MTETYKRAVFVGPQQIRIDELPIPEPGPRQALVKVKACALCTWEQRVYSGEQKFYPLAGGHEVSGELVKVGSQVFTDAQIGDRVMASPLTPLDSSDVRKPMVSATSMGVAIRPGGYKAARSSHTSSVVMPRSSASARAERSAISVRTQPGSTALEVTPCGPASWATDRIRPRRPCFELVYALPAYSAICPAVELVYTTRP